MQPEVVILDPADLDGTLQRLDGVCALEPAFWDELRRVLALYPYPVRLVIDEAQAVYVQDLVLADKFTFDIENDSLVLFKRDIQTLLDALVEMAMYLAGFSTMLGSDDEWVVEFTIGAWKLVKNRVKRELDLVVRDQPRAVVGLPPSPEKATADDPYPFRTLVSAYDLASFYQMVMLAARDDIAVYFPPETHSKVLAVYVYMRRAMQEVAQGVGIHDYETFNHRLLEMIQRLQTLFSPDTLPPPDWLRGSNKLTDSHGSLDHDQADQLGLFPSIPSTRSDPPESSDPPKYNPFESFIEQLFSDDESGGDDTAP